MAEKSLKRQRSETDEDNQNNNIQSKVWVNEKIVNSTNAERMQAVHAKTTELLFKAASRTDTDARKTATHALAASPSAAHSLYTQYQLCGDGTIMLRNLHPDTSNPKLERRKSHCCQRNTLIHDNCVNCTMALCEECGYSCKECQQFICRACVTLFGDQTIDTDCPICERCQIFVQ